MALDDLPPELMEHVVALLSLPDICSLRLSSRTLASKATQDHFKTFFRNIRVEITELGLQKFADATSAGGLAFLIQNLILVAPVYNTLELQFNLRNHSTTTVMWADDGLIEEVEERILTGEELSQMAVDLPILKGKKDAHARFIASEGCVTLLAQAFGNLTQYGVSVASVTTEVVVYRLDATTPVLPLYGGGWKYIWKAANRVFHALFNSIAKAGLRVDRLNLFSGASMHRCSLSCDQFTEIDFDAAPLDACLGNLKSLSMSISDKVMKQNSKEPMSLCDYAALDDDLWMENGFRTVDEILAEATSGDNFTGLASMLQRCRRLEDLTMTRYLLDWPTPEISDVQTEGILQALHGAALSSVRRLTLQGFDTLGCHMLELLSSLPNLECLSLRCIALLDGPRAGSDNWRAILDYCTEHTNELHLDTLRDVRELVFEPPHAIEGEDLPRSKATYRRNVDERGDQGLNARTIRYTSRHGEYNRSPKVRARQQIFENEFGPPKYGAAATLRDVLRPKDVWQLMP